jgi:hypothetical protein
MRVGFAPILRQRAEETGDGAVAVTVFPKLIPGVQGATHAEQLLTASCHFMAFTACQRVLSFYESAANIAFRNFRVPEVGVLQTISPYSADQPINTNPFTVKRLSNYPPTWNALR